MQYSVSQYSCDVFCSPSEANSNDGKHTLSPLSPKKVWQRAKDDAAAGLGQEQIRLSVEEVSNCSSVVQIEPTYLPKIDPPSKCKDQEEVADEESVSQPLNPGNNAHPQADGKGNTVQAKKKKCKIMGKKWPKIGKYC